MTVANDLRIIDRDMASHTSLGLTLVFALVLLVVVWGNGAQISGAVVAPGRVTVDSGVKRIQHREGGIVSEVLVHEGEQVSTGQLLARLDGVVPDANASMIAQQIAQLTVRRWRLEAERDGHTNFATPNADPSWAPIIAGERKLMVARRAQRVQRKGQLGEQIGQSAAEVSGVQAQIASGAAQTRLIQGELTGIRKLYQQGLAPLARVNALEREAEGLSGQRGQLTSEVARARTRVSEIRIQMLEVDSQALAEVMTDLKETEAKLSQLSEQKTAADDQVRRVEIRAPSAGRVQQLALHTRGGVVAPGEPLMLIVPQGEALTVEARVDPQHVDQVSLGRTAHVRFTGFASRTTPELVGRVDRVSADVQTEEKSGLSYYAISLRIDPMALPTALRGRLVPGMPAEVQIETTRHSALSYFLKPISDQLARTFREE